MSNGTRENPSGTAIHRWAGPTLGRACATLGGLVLVGFAALAWFQFTEHGVAGFHAAAIAALVCGLSSLAALILAAKLRNTPHAVAGQLGGSIVRMAPPLVAAMYLQSRVESLATAGVFGCMVSFFLYTLLIETCLLVRLVKSSRGAPPARTSLA